MTVSIYTDGSSLGNPGPGGWAFICDKHEESGHEAHTTNNRMEIIAAMKALEYVQKKHITGTIGIYTDSNLVLSTMTKGWKRKTNHDLWDRLDALAAKQPLQWHKVPAHKDNVLNNRVDELARSAAMKIAGMDSPIMAQDMPTNPHPHASSAPTATAQSSRTATAINNHPISETAYLESPHYLCPTCRKQTAGLLGINKEGTHIRVDCPTCRTFIKFAPHTAATVRIAKKRVLLSPDEITAYGKKLTGKHAIKNTLGKSISKPELKGYTKKEIDALIQSSHNTLF